MGFANFVFLLSLSGIYAFVLLWPESMVFMIKIIDKVLMGL